MGDENELDETEFFRYDRTAEPEEDPRAVIPGPAIRVLAGIGLLVVAVGAGYMFGWILGTVLAKFSE